MSDGFEIRNVTEELVAVFIDDCMQSSAPCVCPRCRADITAYTLNHFPPRYVVTEFGDLMTRVASLSNQFQADIITSIMQSIMVVGNKPRHSAEEIVAPTPAIRSDLQRNTIPQKSLNAADLAAIDKELN